MLLYLGIILVTVAIYVLRFHYDLIHAYWISRTIRGPPALPIIGNGLLFWGKTPTENFEVAESLLAKYGTFSKIWLGIELNVVIADPNDVENCADAQFKIESIGKKWHDRRKIITPAFHFNILQKFVEVFDRLGNTVVEKLNQVPPETYVEFYPIAVLYTLDVMCVPIFVFKETAMGVSIDALSKPNSEYVQAVKKIANVLLIRMFDFILRYPLFYKYSKLAQEEKGALHVLHGFTDSVIRTRRQELIEGKSGKNIGHDEQSEELGIRKKQAFLDLLLHSTIEGKPLTDFDIREEVDTFMFEGHDTTTSGITFCLYNIAKHPEVQQKCYKEVIEIFGTDKKEPTTIAKLNQLSYLELVVKESLRLFPPVPIVGRLATEDIQLTKGRVVPKGAQIFIPIYNLSHNAEMFEDPEEFRPERFLEERSMEKKNPFAYVPFSAGARNCIGQKFAMYEIKSIISKILRNFNVSLTKESEKFPALCAELILRPSCAINFYFVPRI